jgi:hypothetical protein
LRPLRWRRRSPGSRSFASSASVWMIFLSLALAARRRRHIGMRMVLPRMPRRASAPRSCSSTSRDGVLGLSRQVIGYDIHGVRREFRASAARR